MTYLRIKGRPEAIKQICICQAYNFPHRKNSGNCGKINFDKPDSAESTGMTQDKFYEKTVKIC